jgi:hypothetical protein
MKNSSDRATQLSRPCSTSLSLSGGKNPIILYNKHKISRIPLFLMQIQAERDCESRPPHRVWCCIRVLEAAAQKKIFLS